VNIQIRVNKEVMVAIVDSNATDYTRTAYTDGNTCNVTYTTTVPSSIALRNSFPRSKKKYWYREFYFYTEREAHVYASMVRQKEMWDIPPALNPTKLGPSLKQGRIHRTWMSRKQICNQKRREWVQNLRGK